MTKCHKCNHNNSKEHRFCEECGTNLQNELKCNKCGTKFLKDTQFCEECGNKVGNAKGEHHKTKQNQDPNKQSIKLWIKLAIIGSILLIISTIVIFAVPLPYTAKEGYDEQVPYTETETYYESENYQDENCFNRPAYFNSEISTEPTNLLIRGEKALKAICVISNDENQAVDFRYTIETFKPGDMGGCTNELLDQTNLLRKTIGPFQTYKEEVVLQYGCISCIVSPLLIKECNMVTKYRDVPKSRIVTKYKDEYKERFITKYSTLFQQWTGKAEYYIKL